MNKLLKITLSLLLLFLFLKGNHKSVIITNSPVNVDSTCYLKGLNKMVNEVNLSPDAFKYAYLGFEELENEHKLKNDSLITVIDFSKPSDENRFFVFDIKNCQVICTSLVAHGKNSGTVIAESFSNSMQSHKSCLGLFVTGDSYTGRNGYSLKLNGLQPGLNDNALKRSIVIHGADYVSESYIKQNGRIGRSFGCPALPEKIAPEVINLLKGGSCLYIYHPLVNSILPDVLKITN